MKYSVGIATLLQAATAFTLPNVPSFAAHRHVTTGHLNKVAPLHSVATEELTPGINAITSMNGDLEPLLDNLREQHYFRLYSVDMLGSCEYMPQELFECYSETCEIYPVDEDEIPDDIRSGDMDEHDFELDGWARWDQPSEDYYDISQFPEEFTGYDGSEIWTFIHERIAFHDDTITDEFNSDNWKADFNKAVSGLHSCISAHIIKGIEKKIDANEEFDEDCVWTDPQAEFDRRLGENGETPQAMENLYFGYMLLLSAVKNARQRLIHDCESGKIDEEAAEALRPVVDYPLLDDENIRIASRKLHDHAVKDEQSVQRLWEARLRTRDLFRVMNCVQCNKCRLHGKIGAMGLSTAFQVLLGRAGEGGDVNRIHRVELAALMTTLSKFSTAVSYCEKMKASSK